MLADGTTALQSQLLAEHAGEPDAQAKVLAELKSIYGDYKNAKLFKKLGSEVVKFLENTEKVIKDPNSIADIATGWDSKSPFGKATAVFSVVTGFYKAGKSAADGAYLTAASQALSASEGGLQLTAGILAAYSGAAGKAASAAKFIDKYAPIIGAVVDAIQLGRDIGELAHDPNAGEVIKALGTLVCLAGDAFPVVGGILKAGGSVIQFLGGLLDSFYEGKDKKEKLQDEQVKLYMKATGCDEASALEIVQSRSSTIDRLTQLGFSTAQIQALAKDPNVDLSSAETRVAIRAAALFGLDQAETVEFLKLALHDGKFQYDGPLTELAIVLGRPATSVAEGDQVYQRHDLSEVQRRALEQLSYDSPELAAWLEKHQGPPNYDTVFADGIYED